MLEGLGRLVVEDERDAQYPLAAQLRGRTDRTFRYWSAGRWWGDQGGTSQCVVYSWAHWAERPDNIVTPWKSAGGHQLVNGQWQFQGQPPVIDLDLAYKWAQRNDQWPGENYDGTSVRAGAKYLQRRGLIDGYYWTRSVSELAQAVLERGPVVVGTMWTMDMFVGDSRGYITPTGENAGGHAYLIDGVNMTHKFFRLKNSWGRNWNRYGFGRIRFDDMQTLLDNHGEACLPA